MTTPSGKLSWGQAGAYDAIDDRAVIAAVTANRTGLVAPAVVTAGTGLNLTVAGGWLGLASCGDGTSAVVGSRTDQTVTGVAGPATGSRIDYIWCDVQPDNGTWSLTVIDSATAAGRPGMPLATLTVPAGATLATQFTVSPADSLLERRMLALGVNTETNTRTGNTWASVNVVATCTAPVLPGHWYRIVFTAGSPASLSGGPDLRMGIGFRPPGGPESASVMQRGASIAVPAVNRPVGCSLDWVFRYPVGSAPGSRQYDGRIWITGTGSFRTCYNSVGYGDCLTITAEDLGT